MNIKKLCLDDGSTLVPVTGKGDTCVGCHFEYSAVKCSSLCEPAFYGNTPVILVPEKVGVLEH